MSRLVKGEYENHLTNSICKVCGNKTSNKIGRWIPRKLHWYSRKKEYRISLCDDCWQYYLRSSQRHDIIGVEI